MIHDFPLPNWFASLFGPETEPGEGAGAVLRVTCPISLVGIGCVLLGVSLIVLYVYLRENPAVSVRRRVGLAIIRLLQVTLVTLMLCGPTLIVSRTGLPDLALLLDDSLSMTVDGQPGLRSSRWGRVQTLLAAPDTGQLRTLAERYRLRIYYLSDVRSPVTGLPNELADAVIQHEAIGDESRLGDAINRILTDRHGVPPAAVLVLSDGITTAGPTLTDIAQTVARDGSSLQLIGVGDRGQQRDARLSDLMIDPVLLIDDLVPVRATLTTHDLLGVPVRVGLYRDEMLHDGPSHNGTAKQPLAEQVFTPESVEESVPLRFVFRPDEEGRFQYTVRAEPVDEERRTDNNRVSQTIEVRRHRIRVLILQAAPSFEFRFLRDLLGREPTVELRTWLQDADPEHAQQDSAQLRAMPTRDELFEYDVVLLGDADPQRMTPSQLTDLADYVTDHTCRGSLICLAGPNYMPMSYDGTPIGDLLPFDIRQAIAPPRNVPIRDGFQVVPTRLGTMFPGMQIADNDLQLTGSTADPLNELPPDIESDNSRLWRSMPEVYWSLSTPHLKAGARVLAIGWRSELPGDSGNAISSAYTSQPMITFQYVGGGKLLFHNMSTWRWRRGPSYPYYVRYWVQTVRHLAGSRLVRSDQPFELTADRVELDSGQSVTIRLRLFDVRLNPGVPASDATASDDAQRLTVQLENVASHEQHDMELTANEFQHGLYESQLAGLTPGRYRVTFSADLAGPVSETIEFEVRPSAIELDRTALNELDMKEAAQAGDGRYAPLDEAARLIRSLPPGQHTPIQSLPPSPIWNRWPLLLLLLTLATTEWYIRKRLGMV